MVSSLVLRAFITLAARQEIPPRALQRRGPLAKMSRYAQFAEPTGDLDEHFA
jgi:hypothetical protein